MFQEREKLGKSSEGKWAVILAQHLLSQLAIHSNYIIDRQYTHLDTAIDKCFCERKNTFIGKLDDTSFGQYMEIPVIISCQKCNPRAWRKTILSDILVNLGFHIFL